MIKGLHSQFRFWLGQDTTRLEDTSLIAKTKKRLLVSGPIAWEILGKIHSIQTRLITE